MRIELTSGLRAAGLTETDLDRVRDHVSKLEDPNAAAAAFMGLAPFGRHPARELVRHPEWLAEIARGADQVRDVADFTAALASSGSPADLETEYRVLRETKRRASLAIFLREVRGASMRETAAGYADLAQATLSSALYTVDRLRFGGELADAVCIIGMGKLGGRELNPSSDVDVVFVCTDDATEDAELRQRIGDLCRGVVDAMSARTADGYVFRVDLRLRPDGSQGPIVLPVNATVDYYLQYGQTWERSAWMKARPVAGNFELGDRVTSGIEPFVYRRYLDFGALEELRAMKAKIEANASLGAVHGTEREIGAAPARAPLAERLKSSLSGRPRRPRRWVPAEPPAVADTDESGVLGWDVKIGVGGIREIEFFVQALQLVHCGAQPQLRVRNTLEALDALLWAGLIPNSVHGQLADAYDFWRRLEHRVQMAEDRQSHSLPSSWAEFDVFAATCDESREQLRSRVHEVREIVRVTFERLFAPDEEERSSTQPTLEDVGAQWVALVARAGREQLASNGVRAALLQLGFGRPRQVAGQIQVLREKSWGPFRESSWGADLKLAGRILANAAASPAPDQAFSHFSRFAQAVGERPGYWAMLAGNPHSTRLLLQVFGSSGYLSAALIADPNVFERLLAVGTVAVEKSEQRMREELAGRLHGVEDPEHRVGVIRRFHREEVLRVGLHETGGAARVEQTLQQLSVLAEVVIDAVLNEVYEPLRTRRRRPGSVLPPLEEIGFAVVAMGKLGGRELGFGSDLDIVFVYQEDRQWKLEHTFFARLAQRLIRTLSTASAQGKLYEVDTRLRPSGNRGALVVSVDAFSQYYREGAGTWERQALVRARPITGPSALRERIAAIRADVAFGRAATQDERAEIARMRDRLVEALYKRGTRNVKFGPGGLVEVDFATQAAQLTRAAPPEGPPEAVCLGAGSQSTREALIGLGESTELAQDYLWLCRVQARLRMSGDAMTSEIPTDDAGLLSLARRMGHQGDGATAAFLDELDAAMSRAHQFYERVLGG